MKRKRILLEITPELVEAIDKARGRQPRNPWIEQQLWRLKAVRDAADLCGIQRIDRPDDGRGGPRKTKKEA